MKKILTLIITICIFLTACGVEPENDPTPDASSQNGTPAPTADETTPSPTAAPTEPTQTPISEDFIPDSELSHVMGRIIDSDEQYYIVHIIGYGFARQYPTHNLYLLLDKSLIQVSTGDDVVVEYSGEADLAGQNLQSEKVPSEYAYLLKGNTDEYEGTEDCFLLLDTIENIVRVENDGVAKGVITNGYNVYDGTPWQEGSTEVDISYSVYFCGDEYEGENLCLYFEASKAEGGNIVDLNDEILFYYDPDTFEISKVEAVPEE